MKPNNSTAIFFAKNLYSHAAIRESIYSSFASFIAVLILLVVVHYASFGGAFSLLVLASMGASAFLLFAVPHSPMSQPWPVVGGHFLSSVIGVACAQWIDSPALATATAVAIPPATMPIPSKARMEPLRIRAGAYRNAFPRPGGTRNRE